VFYEKDDETVYAVKRPGISTYITGSGQAQGIFSYNGTLFDFNNYLLFDDFTQDPTGKLGTSHDPQITLPEGEGWTSVFGDDVTRNLLATSSGIVVDEPIGGVLDAEYYSENIINSGIGFQFTLILQIPAALDTNVTTDIYWNGYTAGFSNTAGLRVLFDSNGLEIDAVTSGGIGNFVLYADTSPYLNTEMTITSLHNTTTGAMTVSLNGTTVITDTFTPAGSNYFPYLAAACTYNPSLVTNDPVIIKRCFYRKTFP
jgi:hypothetical protein